MLSNKVGYVICIAALLFILVLNIPSNVSCCFDPSDLASIEVVFNKPGVTYNLSTLDKLPNVIKIEYAWGAVAYLYRSHTSKDVVVVVSLQGLVPSDEGEKYIAIRVESDVIQINETITEYVGEIELTNVNITLSDLQRAEALGWSVERAETGSYIRALLTKSVDTTTITVNVVVYEGDVSINAVAEGFISVAESEIAELLNEVFKTNVTMTLREVQETRIALKPKVDEEVLKNALSYEIKWLIGIGVISGLTEDDVNSIVLVAKPGLAGWNNRIVYSNGVWRPYYETDGAVLLRLKPGCSWDYPLEEIPSEPPQTTTYSYPTATTNGEGWVEDMMKASIAILAALLVAVFAAVILRRL